jgi:hypothetical protein
MLIGDLAAAAVERERARRKFAIDMAIDQFGYRSWRLAAPFPKVEQRTPGEHRALVRRRG